MTATEAINRIMQLANFFSLSSYTTTALDKAAGALRDQVEAEKNDPLTPDELREMAQHGLAVWCVDRDRIAQGLLFMCESWSDGRISPHICIMDEEGNPDVYHVEYMAECGAKFYRRKPEKDQNAD